MKDCKVDTLLIGATFWALGYAAASQERCCIVEKSIHLGYEFSDCYKLGEDWDVDCKTAEGEALKKELLGRNIVSPGRLPVLQAYSPLLSFVTEEKQLDLHLATKLIETEKISGGYRAIVYNASGMACIEAKKILFTGEAEEDYSKKSLNVLMLHGKKAVEPIIKKEFELWPGESSSVAYLKVFVDRENDRIAARKKVIGLLRSQIPELEGFQVGCIGSEFEYHYTGNMPEFTTASGRYKNPLEAFDRGAIAGKGGIKE